jgi:hypothetical protein
MPHEAADRNWRDVSGQWNVSVESETDIDKRGPGQTCYLLDGGPACFNRGAVLLGPKVASDYPNSVVHADVLVGTARPALARRDEAGIDTEEAFDDDLESGLFLGFSNHSVDRILPVLHPPSRQRPRAATVRFDRQGE